LKYVPYQNDEHEFIVSVAGSRLGRALGPGGYSLTWQVTSVDTHVTQGTFHFTVS
jgi:methionine-rich copper-binding protein CopC